MIPENIDYDALKKRGFLRQRQDGFFVLRTRMSNGAYSKGQLEKLASIADKYAKGIVHATTRQGLEIPFVRYEDIAAIEEELKASGIKSGASGPRLRATACCPGNNWCKSGLINTFSLYEKIEKGLGLECGLDLPHKFKIAISGCPNSCTRPQHSEIGVHGAPGGYQVYLGGCGGRNPKIGFKLEKIYTEEEVLILIERVVKFYKAHAQPRQRLWQLMEKISVESLAILTDNK